MEIRQKETMKRGDFLRSLGLSTSALMAFYCMGTMTSCSGDDPTPDTGNPSTGAGFTGNADPSKGAVNFTLDLTSSDYSKLKTAGQFVSVGSIIVANAAGSMVAIGRVCTHQGGSLSYRSGSNDFICDTHGGLYNTNGTVKAAPPTQPVVAYKTSLASDKLTVTA
ncbi:QcrA and Rieske domain-containing protein [Tellurirhabdus bombi]|uniref:QcrA and Rieske domain-containing protein n=1 Tax=Tellurirhabdus bombi TaxID=2907205 RepID=UPI001F23A249|nr:Rieske (2Fe-2S) protein [Tellurirhabdus bombi]